MLRNKLPKFYNCNMTLCRMAHNSFYIFVK